MNKKIFFSIISLFCCLSKLLSQDIVLELKSEQESKRLQKYTYSISNSLNNDLAIFIREKKNIQAYLFDNNFKVKSNFQYISSKKKKYNVLLGNKISGEEYSLLYSNSNYTKFCIITFNFGSKTTRVQELDFVFNDDTYLITVSDNNNLYVLTATGDQEISIKKLNDDFSLEVVNKQVLDLDKKQKLNLNKYSYLENWTGIFAEKEASNIFKIDNRIPNAIEQVSKDNKIYKQGGNLYLTFDNKTESTLMYIINLSDFSIERKEFPYPKGKLQDFKKQNSYFLDNVLFQIASSNKEMALLATSLDGDVLRSYYFNKETPINIKNSAIIQDGKTALPFVTTREFEETSKFLRKISSGKLGVSGYKKDNFYHFIIGGVKEVWQGGGMMMPMTTSTTITLPNNVPVVMYNPVFSSFNSYTTTKSTYFKTKLDLDFNYVKGDVNENVFEKIKLYSDSLKYVSAEDVFFHNNKLLFGYYDLKNENYKLVRF
ncbi:hypothetical protein [Algibacter pacificus]|uniref:hypothetical protein n=1 Tax=Algibacter pacificus TaxID=2599389 RepID=UPI0011CBCE97|nr:hypothetical protein [Algibacter pacificus]